MSPFEYQDRVSVSASQRAAYESFPLLTCSSARLGGYPPPASPSTQANTAVVNRRSYRLPGDTVTSTVTGQNMTGDRLMSLPRVLQDDPGDTTASTATGQNRPINRLMSLPRELQDDPGETTVSTATVLNMMVNSFMSFPRELRDEVYGHLWSNTKITFNFLEMMIHALYDGGLRDETPASTTLPSWLLTNKMMLEEGIEHLQLYGEIVMEIGNGEIFLSTHRPLPLRYTIDSNDEHFDVSISKTAAAKIKEQRLIDPTKFRALVIRATFREAVNGRVFPFRSTHNDGEVIFRLTEYLKRGGCHNNIHTLGFELNSHDTFHQCRRLCLSPLGELMDVLPKLQDVFCIIKEYGVEPEDMGAIMMQLYDAWYFSAGGGSSSLLERDRSLEEVTAKSNRAEKTLMCLLRLGPIETESIEDSEPLE